MKKLVLLGLILITASCAKQHPVYIPLPPTIPDLDKKLSDKCPGQPPIKDKSIGALIIADTKTTGDYSKCQVKHQAVVRQYNDAKKSVDAYKASVKAFEDALNKKKKK